MSLKIRIYNLRRKLWGKYEIDDPRPTKAESPYTFYLPDEDRLRAIEIEDSVKIILRSIPQGIEYDAERMWINVTDVDGEDLIGTLDNHPFDMPQLQAGDVIKFKLWNIIDYKWKNSEKENQFDTPPSIQKWERCLVDKCILNRNVPVDYLYKEEPDMTQEGDKYPDSGWRIRGDVDLMTDEEYDNDDATYIALGKVLNADDSWLHLIEEPIGSRFFKNKETGEFIREE